MNCDLCEEEKPSLIRIVKDVYVCEICLDTPMGPDWVLGKQREKKND